MGRLLALAPSLLLASEDDFASAVEAVADDVTASRADKGKNTLRGGAMQRAVYEAAAAIVRDGGAASLLARGAAAAEGNRGGVVLVTEKGASLHVS